MNTTTFFKIIFLVGLSCSSQCFAQISKANNDIGIDVSTFPEDVSFNYDSCFLLGKKLGVSRVGVFQNWTAIETAPNTFNMMIFDIANVYYPVYNMPIDLTIAPIHTNNLEVPSDLTSIAFDDAILIDRFKVLLDSIKAHIPNVTLSSLVIGSEHDAYLETNETRWAQYTTFYNAVSSYAKTLWPNLKVATELTFGGITSKSALAQTLNTNSDYVGVSYYPLNNDFTVKPVSTVPTDFATLVGLYPSKQICFYQYGYPSSSICQSSEAIQAQFIAQTFTTWDAYASNIKMIDFTWLHDLDAEAVNYYGTYYGLTDAIFLEYLRTLGLRHWDEKGTDKMALRELQCQASQRGYNDLNMNCITAINEQVTRENNFNLYPNPANDQLFISLPEGYHAELKLFNMLGQEVYNQILTDSHTAEIKTAQLKSGMYFAKVTTTTNKVIVRSFAISK